MGEMAQEVRQAVVKVVGGSAYSDKLEDDRGFGQQELKSAGVSIIPQQDFTSFVKTSATAGWRRTATASTRGVICGSDLPAVEADSDPATDEDAWTAQNALDRLDRRS